MNKNLRFLPKNGLKDLFDGLLSDGKVFGTIKKDGFPAFAELSAFKELELFLTPTHISAKGVIFPPRETLLKFNIEKNDCTAVISAEKQAIIGLHPCDIRAITLLDSVFSAGAPDANYLARRASTLIIGASCVPDKYCFCKSLGTLNIENGFDIFLHTSASGFIVETGTEAGATALAKYAKTRNPTAKELGKMEAFKKQRYASFTAAVECEPSKLPEIYSKSNDSPVWDTIGSICTGCGSCNNVCPTCYCFDVKDEMTINLNQGERVRYWDACTLEDFAKVAGGHNFRKSRGERLKHRFNRKFNYLTDKFGSLFCVGCGRCSRTCLVKINITEITNELIHEYKSKK
ncbi:hypothetical protein EPN18_06520 [bacterium]|nr:MAG: hypothetical protein EPN18_06520 [bacterium]